MSARWSTAEHMSANWQILSLRDGVRLVSASYTTPHLLDHHFTTAGKVIRLYVYMSASFLVCFIHWSLLTLPLPPSLTPFLPSSSLPTCMYTYIHVHVPPSILLLPCLSCNGHIHIYAWTMSCVHTRLVLRLCT